MSRGEWNGRRISVYTYSVAADDEILQDEDALSRLWTRMEGTAYDRISDAGWIPVPPYTPRREPIGKPFPYYDEDGRRLGTIVMLTVEIPIVEPLDKRVVVE